jgi:hypothetical protein
MVEARPAYHRQTPIQTRAAEPWTLLMAPAKATLLNFGLWIGIGTILAAIASMSPLIFVLIPMALQPVLIVLQFRDPHYMTAIRAWFAFREIRTAHNEIDAVAGRTHLA